MPVEVVKEVIKVVEKEVIREVPVYRERAGPSFTKEVLVHVPPTVQEVEVCCQRPIRSTG